MAQPPGHAAGDRAVRPEQVEPAAMGRRHAGTDESGAIERCELRCAFWGPAERFDN